MKNTPTTKGLLFTAAAALIGYGTVMLEQNFLQGIIALIIGVGVVVLREWIKKFPSE